MANIGLRIKARRKELGISADDLAKRLGKDRSTIYRYEKGEIENLPLDILEPIANALETTPSALMGWEKPFIADAELLADIAGDLRLIRCIRQISSMDESDKGKIYSYVDYIESTK